MHTKSLTLLELKDISLSYGDKKILRDITISIEDIVGQHTIGQVTTLLGRSGSGKSTLFKIIAGLLSPTTGTVRVGLSQVCVEPGMVGMVLQNYPLLEHRTVMRNMQLVCDDNQKIYHFLSEFDIYDTQSKYPKQLSGGQRQRAAIVQQLLSSEYFTLLDEPFSGLDPVATDKLCNNITKMVHSNSLNTVIISSHILEPSIAISDSIWMLGHEYLPIYQTQADISAGQPTKEKIPGAILLHTEDLAAQGLAWNPEIRHDHRFVEKIEELRSKFHTI